MGGEAAGRRPARLERAGQGDRRGDQAVGVIGAHGVSGTDGSGEEGCGICRFVAGEPTGGWIYEDERWRAGVLDGLEAPGWVVVALRRHALEITGMNEDEAATFGPLLMALTRAIKDVTDAERVYVLAYGESHQHWHVLLSPRGTDVPLEHRGAGMWAHREEYRDSPRAAEIAGSLRAALRGA